MNLSPSIASYLTTRNASLVVYITLMPLECNKPDQHMPYAPSVSAFSVGHGKCLDTFVSGQDVNESLHSSNRDSRVEAKKLIKTLSMQDN